MTRGAPAHARARTSAGPVRQRGAALLMAMLTVALVASFAAAALWKQWRGVEVEAAERGRVQSAWLLTGMLDFARLILREDQRASGSVDHLGEPWAVPLQEARLSTFLAADASGAATTTDEALSAFVSGRIVDAQSKFNLYNLVADGERLSSDDLAHLHRLFEVLQLPPSEADLLAGNLAKARQGGTSRDPNAPLMPQSLDQLTWLGVSPDTLKVLRPYVVLVPQRIGINLNTASAEVIYACVDGLGLADAQRLVSERDRSYFRSRADASRVAGIPTTAFATFTDVRSDFFEVQARLRLDNLVVQELALLQRVGNEVSVVRRQRVAPDAGAPAGTLMTSVR